MNKKAMVLCKPDPSGNPRPRRMINLLRELGFQVDVASDRIKGKLEIANHYKIPADNASLHSIRRVQRRIASGLFKRLIKIPGVHFIKMFLYNVFRGTWFLRKVLEKNHYDLLVVEDPELLPVVCHYKGRARILFDAREFYPGQREDFTPYKLKTVLWLCNNYLKQCDQVITVSKGIAEEYRKVFHIDPLLIRSVPPYQDLQPRQADPQQIRLVHHGVATPRRGLENLIEIVNQLDPRFTLDFYLVVNKESSKEYYDYLINLAADNPRVRFNEPVPFEQIIPTLYGYDIMVIFYKPIIINHLHSLPNKFFESVQARLMLATGPSPDMAELVNQYQCGIVSPDFTPSSMARCLNQLTKDQIMRFKENAHQAAKELCFEKESQQLIHLFQNNWKIL